METRLKMGVLSTGLQTPATESRHGADGALAVVQRTPLMLAVPDWASAQNKVSCPCNYVWT